MDYISDEQKTLYIYTPYADLRFKMAGGGRNFVHGGLSLQEIAIPVLLYNHNKSLSDLDKKGIEYGKVGITLIGQSRKITNNPFKNYPVPDRKRNEKRGHLKCRIASMITPVPESAMKRSFWPTEPQMIQTREK
jgi:hypothetical protein